MDDGVAPAARAKRLFIAVDIDETTREQVGRISMHVREVIGRTKASWVRSDRMHLTLHFFGSADTSLEERVREALAGSVATARFDISFAGLGFFPERGSPRVLWLGVSAGLEPLRRLQRALAIRGERRVSRTAAAFNPHLTLARLKERVPREKVAEIVNIRALAGPVRIDRVTLYESRLSPAGPTYIPLAEALLLPSD